MDAFVFFACGAAMLACLAVVVALALPWRRGGRMIEQPQAVPPVKGSFGARAGRGGLALGREILPLLEQGRTDEAVALVREQTGWSEEEARASVTKLTSVCKRLGM